MFARFKKWRDERRFKKAVKILQDEQPKKFAAFVMERASEVAAQILMQMLDREGFRHCHLCPSREQLRIHNGKFHCIDHFTKAVAQQMEEPAVPAGSRI